MKWMPLDPLMGKALGQFEEVESIASELREAIGRATLVPNPHLNELKRWIAQGFKNRKPDTRKIRLALRLRKIQQELDV